MTPYAVAPLASLTNAPLRCHLFPSSPRLPHLLPPRPHSNGTPNPFLSTAPPRCLPSAASAVDSPTPFPSNQTSRFKQWDSMTAKFAGASNVPFLLIQLPQILLNSRNLLAGSKAALFAVPWLGMLNGLLGNLTLLSYFAKKKETEAIVVQTLGVVSIYVVIAQLAIAGAVPLPHFTAISAVVASGLVLNFMNYFNWIGEDVWLLWEDFITITGLSVLPQARTGKLSEKGVKFVRSISGWTATLLFMWMPIAQMWTSYLNPDNIKGLSAFTLLLGMIGNVLMVPRALFIRDLMWNCFVERHHSLWIQFASEILKGISFWTIMHMDRCLLPLITWFFNCQTACSAAANIKPLARYFW